MRPLKDILHDPPAWPSGAETSHPFTGGESHAWDRLKYLITSNIMLAYNTTRNGLTGVDFSTKLSAYLALGCITARQIHQELLNYEDGKSDEYKTAEGYGQGQNDGTESMRFELLWRDYMHLCTAKFGTHLFHLEGFRREADSKKTWLAPEDEKGPHMKPGEGISGIINRFLEGTTGMGFIDASQRELYNTGYTSNRTRQNVASFLTKHLGIDWRYGAEWYECMLVDHDVASNWSNWQYVAGVGNDPRGDARIFNPVKQAFDYDKDGSFVKMWLPEVRGLPKLENIFQPWTASRKDLEAAGLADSVMVEHPLKKIHFNVDRRPTRLGRGTSYPPRGRGRGRGRGGGRGGRGGGGGASTSTGNQENTSGDKGSGSQEGGGHTNHSSRGVDNGGRGGGRGQRGGSTAAFKARPGPTRPSPMSDDASARSSSGSKTDGSSGGIFPPATKIQQATVRPYNSAKIVNSSLRTKPNVASGPNRGHILAHGTGPWMAHPSQQHQIPRAQAQMQTRMHNHIQTWSQHHHGPQYQGHANSYHAEGGYDYHSPTSMHPYTQQPMTGPPMTGMPIVMGGQYMNRGYNSYPQAQSYPIAQPVWGDFGGLWQQPGGYVAQPAPQHSPPYYTMPPPHAGPAFSSGH